MENTKYTVPFGGKDDNSGELTIDFNTGAARAHGSVITSAGGTTVLTAVTFDEKAIDDEDFNAVPLRVDYLERYYAVHQILGPQYTRREGRPSDEAITSARLIDRSIRPHLPAGLRHPLHVVVTVLSLGDQDPDTLAILGASLAINQTGLDGSDIIAATRVLVGDKQTVQPSFKDRQIKSGAEMIIAGSGDLINMVDLTATNEVSEEQVSSAYVVGLKANKELLAEVTKSAPENSSSDLIKAINDQVKANNIEKDEYAAKLATGWRADGRGANEVRPLEISVGELPGVHGSARFSRGDTTVLAVATLDTPDQTQSVEAIEPNNQKAARFINHYNFPPYAVGNAGRIGSPNRREIGHGKLATRALEQLLPAKSEYPYAIRLVSEVLSADGSSSMAAVCAGSLALHTAGTPIHALCAGVAIGLAGDVDDKGSIGDYVLLTDICADEDRSGLMDCKIAGTKNGITALQLDTKSAGISLKMFSESLEAGVGARVKILDAMSNAVSDKTFGHPDNAPLIVEIPRGHIGRIIGKGGSNIRDIEDKTGARVSIERDQFAVIHGSGDAKKAVLTEIEAETREYNVGEDFKAFVREFLPYGAIVELDAGREALLHVSELRDEFVERTEDLLKVGDEIPVTIVETSSDGRVKVSIREKYPEFFKDK